MSRVSELAAFLDQRVPNAMKMDFDNVGLLFGFPESEVHRILLSLDVTSEVIAEAEQLGAELIVSHHPLIFHPLKQILATDEIGRKLILLARKGISVISLHTNLDVADGGVNDALSAVLGAQVTEKLPCGRVSELPEAESIGTFLARVKDALGVSGLRYWDAGRTVKRIVLCGGSGGDLVSEAIRLGADTLLTGEIRYDQWLTGREMGINLVDADHFCTENVVLPVLEAMLHEGFPDTEVVFSAVHSQTLRGFGE